MILDKNGNLVDKKYCPPAVFAFYERDDGN
jgi:hypothetical protein